MAELTSPLDGLWKFAVELCDEIRHYPTDVIVVTGTGDIGAGPRDNVRLLEAISCNRESTEDCEVLEGVDNHKLYDCINPLVRLNSIVKTSPYCKSRN